MQTQVRLLIILACLFVTSCSPATGLQPTLSPSETPTSIPSPTETLTPTITPIPTIILTPKPTRTPIPDFPHKIVDGKIVFEWSADLSTFPDITKGGSIPLTKELIFNWINSLNSQGLNSPMPTADTVCQFNWHQGHSGGDTPISQVLGLGTGPCTKDTSPVRVRAASKAHGNLQAEDGNWYSIDVVIFAYRVFTTDDPNGFIDIPVVLAQSSDDIRDGHIRNFNDPTRYLSIDFQFSNPELPALYTYAPQGVARFLQSIGIYDQTEVDTAMSDWAKANQPTNKIKGKVLVGHASSLSPFNSP